MVEQAVKIGKVKIFLRTTFLTLTAVICAVWIYFWLSGEVRQSVDRKTSAPKSGRFVQVDGNDIFLQEMGPANGTVLVFVHATIAWGGTWQPTMSWFAERGFHCIAVDMPPMGYSSSSATGYGRETQGKLLARLLEILNLRNVVLIGHSFGARATLTAAALARDRLQNLIIASGAIGWTNEASIEQPQNHSLLRSLLSLNPVQNLLGSVVTHPSITRPGLELFVAKGYSVDDQILKIYQEPFFLKNKSSWVGDWMVEFLTSEDVTLANDTTEIFPKLTIKTLLIWGREDITTPVWQGERLAHRLPSAQLVLLDGVGHLPQIEKPYEFRQSILNFLITNFH